MFEFGEIAAGAVVNHEYTFTNAGTAPLVVAGVYPSCDCTTAGRWSARVEPGQAGTVPIHFNSAGYGGAIDKWILVTSNDPHRPEVMLVLKGTVWAPIDVAPANAVFAPAAGTPASETKVIRITSNTAGPLVLSAPESTNRAFDVNLRTVRPGKEFELRVTTVPPFGASPIPGLISVKTNSSQMPVITITALALVRKPVATVPSGRQTRPPSDRLAVSGAEAPAAGPASVGGPG